MKMRRRKWPVSEQALFLKKMAELLTRGYPLTEAVESLAFQLPAYRKEELNLCLDMLKKGHPFHYVLENLHFNRELTGYVFFAEQHGSFAPSLLEGSEIAIKREQDRGKLVKILQYPILLILITGFLFAFVEKTLLPKFTALFKTMNLENNMFTSIVYSFSKYTPICLVVLLLIAGISLIYYFLIFRKQPALSRNKSLVRLPFAGKFIQLWNTQYFAVQLSFLLSGGLSITEALRLFENNSSHPFFSELGKVMTQKLLTGEGLEDILSEFPFFDKEFSRIVRHGQNNGKLEQELYLYSRYCISRLEEKIDKYSKIAAPAIYLFIGFMVVSMYLSILLPMFHLMDGF